MVRQWRCHHQELAYERAGSPVDHQRSQVGRRGDANGTVTYTRSDRWGIPIPLEGYENKVIYVWYVFIRPTSLGSTNHRQ